MRRLNLYIMIMAIYVLFFIVADVIIPIFLPKFSGDLYFMPFFFFIPFFLFGRRSNRSSGNRANPDSADSDSKNDDATQYNYENYDEYGIIKRKSNTRIFYLIGASLIAIAIIILVLKLPSL